MTDTYKILGQALTGELALDGTTVKETLVYEVPAGTKASVSAIEITNSDSTSKTYKVAFVPFSDTESTTSSVTQLVETEANNNIFIASPESGDQFYKSSDGINWSEFRLPFASGYYSYSTIGEGNGKFLAFSEYGGSAGLSSTDGTTWTSFSTPEYTYAKKVSYGNGVYIVLSNSNNYLYSVDGINWTSMSSMPLSPWFISYGNGRFVILTPGSSSNPKAAYSTNGIDWTVTDPGAYYWSNLTYGSGKFVAIAENYPMVGLSSAISYSEDAVTWTKVTPPINGVIRKIAYGNGKFVILQAADNNVMTSTDGITWTSAFSTLSSQLFNSYLYEGISYANGKFAMINNGNAILYSTDAITWTYGEVNGLWIGDTVVPESNFLDIVSRDFTESIASDVLYTSLNKHIAIYNKIIAPGETHEIKGGVTLSAGDQIRVYSDSNEIITNVYGVEIA
jgi:hypothetical protein